MNFEVITKNIEFDTYKFSLRTFKNSCIKINKNSMDAIFG